MFLLYSASGGFVQGKYCCSGPIITAVPGWIKKVGRKKKKTDVKKM